MTETPSDGTVAVPERSRHTHEPSLADLFGRIAELEGRVRVAVERRRALDPDPDDRFRGLYISEAQVDQLLDDTPVPLDDAAGREAHQAAMDRLDRAAGQAIVAGADVRIRGLARMFDLDAVDLDILIIALAPDLDPRFERLYAYLQDDVSRRRASTGLAIELASDGVDMPTARRRLSPSSPLVAGGLLLVEDGDRPFLTRSLRVPDRVAAHLLLDDTPDLELSTLRLDVEPIEFPLSLTVSRSLRNGTRLWYVRERFGSAGVAMAAAAIQMGGTRALAIDLARLGAGDDVATIAAIAAREARLRNGGLIAGPVEVLAERGAPAVRALAEAPCPVVLVGSKAWDPGWSRQVPVLIDAPLPSPADRSRLWAAALEGDIEGLGIDGAMAHFRLSPEQIVRAARSARQQALAEDRTLATEDLHHGARSQNAAGLERLARRVRPLVNWDDLVLTDEVRTQLRELAARARHREVVLDRWGMGSRSSKGRGLAALFAGDSGTGKTMSAEVLAGDLGLDLYVIDLSTVIDKYVGETEKNLDRIFTEADRVNGVLLFDEADAVFGKRSDVKDSHDRYANVEVAYLLQRMEQFDGLAILTTNLRSNLDDAFTRRLDSVVDFPVPDEDDRLRLWLNQLGPGVPIEDDLDLDFLAQRFKLSGGNIRNIALSAAYLAAAGGRPLRMSDLIHGTMREYQKLGRLTVESEFGPYYEQVR